ncbi:membrane-spanning 4-domains subfamily A member 4A-like [Choloepus didactylus]|uniref:membrane-spanning 4-domains subfamily A member 4A-like n=1 Tax=Choloepus didactylus TaxID=27675 RepID=UPI00189D64DF|nr:membrane-spanning 4-domains subfamily A member 4A-like [Choloepus didactylus]XP_037695327.1 membrane-spanning 4-domains subfamily A member 4A-like [Choloepus didactylus]XP_037695328.1 membrane-spanning 4-domains subfamily A member 4A-like [Choloepus didactylus]XP_037695329.1 membrane-spanning 4-domains subfamily A member 4A-like [Choloepus didactylus]XP_037695330.1 membrane-spanning 4-domains subfamily A member 4A-like [Choloepus didactylus]XP_037695332.1 membrane-spanning 4-domains subfami
MEQTAQELGAGLPQLRQLAAVQPLLWKGKSEKFLKGEPKILGVVQILIALMNLSLGIIVMTASFSSYYFKPFSVYTGYSVWGSVMFIISGSFSVAAGNRTTKGLVQSSLGLNITSSVFAAVGFILYAVSVAVFLHHYHYCYNDDNRSENCYMFISILLGMEIIVLILSVLEFCIAVSLSAFGCKACCNRSEVVFILPSNPHVVETAPPADRLEA